MMTAEYGAPEASFGFRVLSGDKLQFAVKIAKAWRLMREAGDFLMD